VSALRVEDKIGRCLFANRPCDRVVGRDRDTVFIAAPSDDQYHFETDAAERAVRAANLSPMVAVHESLLSRDVFCEKICTHIIESRFCVVFLNGGNPNVFYEYGIMRPFRKRVISLQRAEERPPFNVQHLDIVRYPRATLKEMLKDAVEAATAATASQPASARRTSKRPPSPFAARVTNLLELVGISGDPAGGLASYAEGTPFATLRGRTGVHYVAVLEAGWSLEDVLADTMLVCRRLDREYRTLRGALAVRENKGWRRGEREHRDRMGDMEDVTFVYATLETPAPTASEQIASGIQTWKLAFPTPTVVLWSSEDVERQLANVVTTGGPGCR